MEVNHGSKNYTTSFHFWGHVYYIILSNEQCWQTHVLAQGHKSDQYYNHQILDCLRSPRPSFRLRTYIILKY